MDSGARVRERRYTIQENSDYVGSYRNAAIYRWYTGAHTVNFRAWLEFNETLPPGQDPYEYIDHIYATTCAVDRRTHGCKLRDGKKPSKAQWTRWAEAAHEYNTEYGWGGVRHIAKEAGVNERTLARHLKKWRASRGIVTNQQKARLRVLARDRKHCTRHIDEKTRKC